eukprot:scaffold88147_cov31-Prasinocladus_malaysianus.AAC.1
MGQQVLHPFHLVGHKAQAKVHHDEVGVRHEGVRGAGEVLPGRGARLALVEGGVVGVGPGEVDVLHEPGDPAPPVQRPPGLKLPGGYRHESVDMLTTGNNGQEEFAGKVSGRRFSKGGVMTIEPIADPSMPQWKSNELKRELDDGIHPCTALKA